MRARRIGTIAVGFPAVYYTYHYIIGLLHSNFMPNYDHFGKTNKVNSPAAGPWDARLSRSGGRRACHDYTLPRSRYADKWPAALEFFGAMHWPSLHDGRLLSTIAHIISEYGQMR